MPVKRIAVMLWALLYGTAGAVPPPSAAVNEAELTNGMKVVIKEDHRAPVAIAQVWYRVGAVDEFGGITGVSHVLEHMMFKGTSCVPAGKFSEIIARQGGKENAFTSREYTGYYQMLEKSRLPIAFRLESDRMRNLLLPEDEFWKELDVVKEERRMRTEDNPNGLAYEALYALAFDNNPLQHPVIGWMEDLDQLHVEDLRRWYEQWYSPNNATLVVVGDVDPDEIFALAQSTYGELEARSLPERKHLLEPPQRGPRRGVVRAPAKLPYLVMGYKVPVLGQAEEDWEAYALEVLAGVLDAGRSARLSTRLVRGQEVAASAGAGYSLYGRYNGLFLLDGIPASGRTIEEVQNALEEQVADLRENLVTADELKRIKAQVLASEIFSRDSISSQASQIGSVEMAGLGWEVLEQYVPRVQAVTPEQVRAVARKYLVDKRRTMIEVEPIPIGGGDAPPAREATEKGERS